MNLSTGKLSQTQGPYTVHNILQAPGFIPSGNSGSQGGNLGGYITGVTTPEHFISHFTDTGHVVRKPKKTAFVTEFNPVKRAPGVFPSMVGSVAGAGTSHGNAEFRLEQSFVEALQVVERQQAIDATAKYWPEPEHYRYFDRSKETIGEYYENVAFDNQRRKIEILKDKGYTDQQIETYLESIKMKDIDKALKDPSNVTNLLEAQIASTLPTREVPDFPVRTSEGGVPLAQNASAYQLATGNLTRTQRSKQQSARRVREAQGVPAGQQRLEELLTVRRGVVEDSDRDSGFTSAGSLSGASSSRTPFSLVLSDYSSSGATGGTVRPARPRGRPISKLVDIPEEQRRVPDIYARKR